VKPSLARSAIVAPTSTAIAMVRSTPTGTLVTIPSGR
jgi:hypothetical protein